MKRRSGRRIAGYVLGSGAWYAILWVTSRLPMVRHAPIAVVVAFVAMGYLPLVAWVVSGWRSGLDPADWPQRGRPCARCGYDMTGLRSGRCPECGGQDLMKWR